MSLTLKVYDNGDHTCLVWLPTDEKPVPECLGFTLRRLLNGTESYLHGFVGFSDGDKLDPNAPWKFPLQRFMWWDYLVNPGDKVQYSVVPVTGPSSDQISLASNLASPLTPLLEVTGQESPHISAYFNRGIIATQWVSRDLQASKGSSIKQLIVQLNNPVRNALSGLLRPRLLELLSGVKAAGGSIYAALYELNDPELIAALKALGKSCHLILGNGAFKGNTPPGNDENHQVRAMLRDVVDLHDRIVTSPHFAHNKFVVFCDSGDQPQTVLTGSTNWTSSGLCTQANNAVIIDDAAVAQDFKAAWVRLQAADNGYPPDLVSGNSASTTYTVDGCSVTPWFVKTSAAQDLQYSRKLIDAATDGILFLFFNPGTFQQDPMRWTLLQNILDRHNAGSTNVDLNLYIRGVVNQEIPQLTEPGVTGPGKKPLNATLDASVPAPVTLYSGGGAPPTPLSQDVLVPRAIKNQFHGWEKELLGASMVNIHSKVIVLDPFGAKPVVMTGSHNLGFKASSENDDNLVIIEGNAPLAAAYAANIIAIYQTYRWNAYVEAHLQDPQVWHGLQNNDQWQTSYLANDQLAELRFWLGARGPVATVGAQAAAAPASGTNTARVVVASGAPKKGSRAPAKGAAAAKRAVPKSARRPPKKRVTRATKKQKNVKKKNVKKKRARN